MNQQRTITLSISQPCHESWNEMTPADKGRFCLNCQKTVTDFSGMSDQQILSFLSNRQGNVCGRFHTEQLNREIRVPGNTRRQPIISIAAMVAALTVLTPSVQAQVKQERIQLAPDESTVPQPLDTLPHITGVVKDSTTNAVLPGAIVKIKGHAMQTVTDSTGKFEFQIPVGIAGNDIILEVEYIGFMKREVVVPLASEIINIDILMQPVIVPMRSLTMGAVVTITSVDLVQEKRTPWQRFKHNVGQLFR